jgi:hypothetical protein
MRDLTRQGPDSGGDLDGVCRAFDIQPASAAGLEMEARLAALHAVLSARIEFLLVHEFEMLLAALYRIDVDEDRAAQAFALRDPPVVASRLADLVIARHLEKRKRPRTADVEDELL